jgi:hypothetical protein
MCIMRTTVSLADDVAAAVERLRRERGIGLSEALNELARRGLVGSAPVERFRQETSPMGARLDVSNVAEALETLDRDDPPSHP